MWKSPRILACRRIPERMESTRVIESSKLRPAGVRRSLRPAVVWLVLCVAFAGGCTKTDDPHADESATLKSLLDDYKLDNYEKNSEDRVAHVRMEAPRFDDNALALTGKFKELQGLSIWKSAITDAGLEKLPVLKNLQSANIMADGVTDRGLKALARQPSLQDIWLVENDRITAAGMDALKKVLPSVRLHVMNRPAKKTAKKS